jgi:hypothetical protein
MIRRRSWIAAVVLVTLVVAAGASAQTRQSTVTLKVRVTGLGTVRITGGASFTCREYPCVHTFQVPRGRRIAVTVSAAKGWKLTKWAGACKGARATCSLRLRSWRIALVTFVPPGNWLNPYPPKTAVTLEGGWRVKVDSAKINANSEVEAVPNPVPALGDQYTVVNLSLTYTGDGPGLVSYFLFQLSQLGAAERNGNGLYPPDSCVPPGNDLGSAGTLITGQTLKGTLCYEIASNGANSLRLMGVTPPGGPETLVWFALR